MSHFIQTFGHFRVFQGMQINGSMSHFIQTFGHFRVEKLLDQCHILFRHLVIFLLFW